MSSPSVDDAALEPPGQSTDTASSPLSGLDRLGEIEVAGEPASVVWPQLGGAVAIDFKRDGYRYALVSGLDSNTPRLSVQAMHGRQVDADGARAALTEVVALWTRP